MSTKNFAENERNIIELLEKNDFLSKAEIARMGGMSWATVVKMTKRLLEREIVVISGTGENQIKPGKNELLYSLSGDKPLAVGVDVEYMNTRIILMNFRGKILSEATHVTPQRPKIDVLKLFLVNCLAQFLEQIGMRRQHVIGIGVGLPGGVIPAWLRPDSGENRSHLQEFLTRQIGLPVVTETNQRVCTNYLKWKRLFFPGEDFGLVTIRTGVGMGVILRGELFVSHQSISTEIGHIKLSDGGVRCRCGAKGCLEPLINQAALFSRYETRVLKRSPSSQPSLSEVIAGLHDLFSRASRQEPEARRIVQQMAILLGRALSSCLMTVFVPNIVIGGYFGEEGRILLPMVESQLEKELLPSMKVNLRYISMEHLPFAEGDALLAITAYLYQ